MGHRTISYTPLFICYGTFKFYKTAIIIIQQPNPGKDGVFCDKINEPVGFIKEGNNTHVLVNSQKRISMVCL